MDDFFVFSSTKLCKEGCYVSSIIIVNITFGIVYVKFSFLRNAYIKMYIPINKQR